MLLGPTQSLAAPPGRRGFLGVLPRPSASRPLVRYPSDPRSSNPRVSRFYPSYTRISLRFLPGIFALRIDTPGASPLPPRLTRARRSPSTLAGFQLRSRGPAVFPPSLLPAHFYMCRSSAGSSRFLPYSRPAASIRLFGTHCLRRELLPAFGISRNPGNVLILS